MIIELSENFGRGENGADYEPIWMKDLNQAAFTASSSTAPLRNMIFCFTGMGDRKASLTKILKQMGADVQLDLTMDGDVLIADGFRSAKYLVRNGEWHVGMENHWC